MSHARSARAAGRPQRRLRPSSLLPLVTVVVAVVLGAVTPAPAAAGTFTVSTCRTPSGAPAPIDGWSATLSPSVGYGGMANSCASGGPLSVYFDPAVGHPNQDHMRMEFKPGAPGLILRSATLWRMSTVDRDQANAVVVAYISSPGPGYDASMIDNRYGAGTFGNPSVPLAPENRLDIPASRVGTPESVIGATVACSSVQIQDLRCTAGASVNIFAAQIQLDDTAAPTVTSATGDLADRGVVAPEISGRKSLLVQASDVGSGLARAVVLVDDKEVATASFGDNAGRCVPVAPRNYLWRQPCAASGGATIAFDSSTVPDGDHQVQVVVEDASGGRTVAATGRSSFKNATRIGPGSPLALRGEPNGNQATDEAALVATWPQTAKPASTRKSIIRKCAKSATYRADNPARCNGLPATATVVTDWSKTKANVLAGRLTTAAGVPIAGAAVEATSTPTSAGAAAAALPTATTDADGRFTFSVARAAGSAVISVQWRARLNDTVAAVSASATTRVRASTGLVAPRSARRNSKVTFSGTLRGKAGILSGVPVSLQSRNGRKWQTFATIPTNANGKWRKRITFAKTPGTYRVRARIGTVATYPWEPGYSAETVTVRVR